MGMSGLSGSKNNQFISLWLRLVKAATSRSTLDSSTNSAFHKPSSIRRLALLGTHSPGGLSIPDSSCPRVPKARPCPTFCWRSLRTQWPILFDGLNVFKQKGSEFIGCVLWHNLVVRTYFETADLVALSLWLWQYYSNGWSGFRSIRLI